MDSLSFWVESNLKTEIATPAKKRQARNNKF